MERDPESLSLGELATLLYEEFLLLYKNEDLASVAAAMAINDLLSQTPHEELATV